MYETTVRAGELIFLPAGYPHQVLNEEGVVAVSSNFIDSTNIGDSLKLIRKQLRTRQASSKRGGEKNAGESGTGGGGLDLARVEERLAEVATES
jgi:hypothetical protein